MEKYISFLGIPASLLFIISIYGLTSVETSKKSFYFGGCGMIIATLSILLDSDYFWNWALVGLVAPFCLIGLAIAIFVKMTSMPEMVGLLNGFGGLSAFLVSIAYFDNHGYVTIRTLCGNSAREGKTFDDGYEHQFVLFTVFWGVLVGTVTWWGSLVACFKLMNIIPSRPIALPKAPLVNVFILLILFGLEIAFHIVWEDDRTGVIILSVTFAVATIFGLHWVSGIGGGDMPVVIAMLNALSGISGAFTGLTLKIDTVILCGALVGASGLILSYLMCVAMGRSIMNVMIGGFGGVAQKKPKKADDLTYSTIDTEKLARLFQDAKNIVIVPGYGMAVAQAQYPVSELTTLLKKQGKKVRFAIHPVAGRMPGHMNVLLAEARVPYDLICGMDEINDDFKSTDIALIMGANDVVNPAAVDDPDCLIYGMPVLKVWESKHVIIIKRTMAAGFSGVFNPLFYRENTMMYLGDAKKQSTALRDSLQEKFGSGVAAEEKKDDKWVLQVNKDVAIEMQDLNPEVKEEQTLASLPTSRNIGVISEADMTEKRLAITPSVATRLRKAGFQVFLQSGAGLTAEIDDSQFISKAVKVVQNRQDVFDECELVIKVLPPTSDEINSMKEGTIVISLFYPANNSELIDLCLQKKITIIAMDQVPRITRAQKCDVLSSMGLVSGYRAVLESSYVFGSFMQQQITAAGKVDPAKVLIIGAGVAGLAAIGVARAMGAIVRCFDVRPVCAEQVQSLGAEFLSVSVQEDGSGKGGYAKTMSPEFIAAELALFHQQCKEVNIIITTALIPGRPAPKLILDYMVDDMMPGSVIVDLAAQNGGNCQYTEPGKLITTPKGVKVIGYLDLPGRMPYVSSQFYGSNICCVLDDMGSAKGFHIDMDDDEIGPMVITKDGEKKWPYQKKEPEKKDKEKIGEKTQSKTELETLLPKEKHEEKTEKKEQKKEVPKVTYQYVLPGWLVEVAKYLFFIGIAFFAGWEIPIVYQIHVLIFLVSGFLGYLLIWNVTPMLHTPLMSFTNALSGIVFLTAISQIGSTLNSSTGVVSFIASGVGLVNVVGGFSVTQRMLSMFQK